MAAAPADAAEGAQAGAGQEIVFVVEVPDAQGLPKPEQTIAKLGGFGISGWVTSVAAPEASSEPSGWLFPTEASLKAAAQAADAKDAKGKKGGDPAPAEVETEPAYKLSRPCGTADERQQLLDSVCSPLEVVLTRSTEPFLRLGTATFEMQDLIHDAGVVEREAELHWSEELLAELRAEFEESVAASKAEAAEAAPEGEGEEAAEGAEPEAVPLFEAPPPGKLRAKVSTAGPVGRALCPEDLHDWAVLSVQIDGCYGLPESMMKLAEAPEPAAAGGKGAPPPTAPDVGYSLRILGCSFEDGKLIKPETAASGEEGSRAPSPGVPEPADGEAAEGEEGAEGADQTRAPSPPAFHCDIGQEEFIEGLLRSGFPSAAVDGPAIFEFMSRPRTGMGGKIGPQEFARLEEIGVPAEAKKLVALYDQLIEKDGTLDEAFGALDQAGTGVVNKEAFTTALEALGYAEKPEEVDALFSALDSQQEEVVSREDLRMLGIYKRMSELQTLEKVRGWLLACTGSVESLVKQVDETKSGSVTLESWKAAMEKLGYPDLAEAELLFKFLDTAKEESMSTAQFDALKQFDVAAITEALPELEEFLVGQDGDTVAAIQRLLGSANGETVSLSEFTDGCGQLGYSLTPDPRAVFALLDATSAGCFAAADVEALLRYNVVSRRRKLAACTAFIKSTFGGASEAFMKIFDDRTDFYSKAEETMARIEWSRKVVAGYRGRQWLQMLLNTLHDARGRKCAANESSANGGCWLYFFPKLGGQDVVQDFKDMPDAQSATARLARWHHAQGFVDMRRLSAPVAAGSFGPEVEFRAFLSQIAEQPEGVNAAGDLPAASFGTSQTYVKGVIRLDRPLVRLCPRDIQPLPEPGGQPFIPPPPPKTPPPTVIEELEFDARRIVGKLAVQFARMCKEHGFEEQQGPTPSGAESPHHLLGRRGVTPQMFYGWLMEQDDGQVYKELSTDLRPAIVKMVRSEAKDGPACGLCGNDDDARYSFIRDMILKHLFKALNQDVILYKRKRDAQLWRSPLLHDDADARDPNFGKPADLAAQEREQDATLRRLAFEYELIGDFERAAELFKERLDLPTNKESGEAWFGFARFLMRCGQKQPAALEAVRYATSLRPAESGPSLEEAAFLACILLNYDLSCTGGDADPPEDLRFDAAISILAGYADQHPGEPEPLYLLFAAYAKEATKMQAVQEDAAAILKAEAAKYLRLARTAKTAFAGTLGKPEWPDLQALVRRERLARGLEHEVRECPSTPSAWEPTERPDFPAFEEVHRLTNADDTIALGCIDMMLRLGTPALATFLLEASAAEEYNFVSKETAESDRCCMQLIKAAMLGAQWDQAIALIEGLLARCNRIREAYVLLGECHFRKAREAASLELYAQALQAFKAALSWLPDPGAATPPEVRSPKEDPVLHLRVATIYSSQAALSGFADKEAMAKAEEHYTKALQIAPTAEAWKNAGICAYRRAHLEGTTESRRPHLKKAVKCLGESNLLDKCRPQVNAWLAICSVELGRAQVAKQAVRQVLRFGERLDVPTALELAEVLLHFSDEGKALPGERPLLVQENRYATEAIAVSRFVLERLQSGGQGGGSPVFLEEGGEADPESAGAAEPTLEAGRARYVLAQAQALKGEDETAVAEFLKALPCFQDDAAREQEVVRDARACAARLLGEPQWAKQVEEIVAEAAARRQQAAAAPGGDPSVGGA